MRILAVDDDPDVLEIISIVLRTEGYEVTTRACMRELTSLLEHECFDLFVLDMRLPDGDGLECCKFIRSHSDSPIIILSGWNDLSNRITAFDIGADDYVMKPIEPREFAARIRAQFRRKSRPYTSDETRPLIRLPQRFDKYVLHEKLGEGGMGTVYLATQAEGVQVAVKMLSESHRDDPKLVARFQNESTNLMKLNHPNLVCGLNEGVIDDVPYFVMEYLTGETVESMMRQGLSFSIDKAVDVVRQTARGLEYAHNQGIMHRDIKPANLFLTRQGTVKIIDFGISRNLSSPRTVLTEPQFVVGTPHYIAPEQAQGKMTDHRADIYGLGVTFFEMLTYCVPFEGTSLSIVMQKISAPPPDPRLWRPEISEGVASVILKMLATNPNARFRNCGEVLAALDRLT